MNQVQPGSTPVTGKLVHEIAKVFWGSYEAGDVASYEGKALASKKIQDRTYIKESLGLCDFAYPITYSLNTPDNYGRPRHLKPSFSRRLLASRAEKLKNTVSVYVTCKGLF
jgi:hypothetical protein